MESNTITNTNKRAFAGLAVGWFPNGGGNHQNDGNLVLYESDWDVAYNFGISSGTPNAALMQGPDGNFVVYDAGWNWYFATWTQGNPGAYLVVQGDGNVVVYSLSGNVLWSIF